MARGSKFEVKLNSAGIRSLLRSEELGEVIRREWTSKVHKAMPGSKMEDILRPTRRVQTVIYGGRSMAQLRRDNKHVELLQALQSTGAPVKRMKFETRTRRSLLKTYKAASKRKAEEKRRRG